MLILAAKFFSHASRRRPPASAGGSMREIGNLPHRMFAAGGEIPHHEKRIGRDGVKQPARPKAPNPSHAASKIIGRLQWNTTGWRATNGRHFAIRKKSWRVALLQIQAKCS
jgi:hypothetical protein